MRWRWASRIAATQLLAARGSVDLGKSIYLQPSFSAPVMFFGGLLFGYGMVLSNGCGSRALVLLGRGNLRSFVVVIVLGIFAQMTLKGLIAPARIAVFRSTQTDGEDQLAAGAAVAFRLERNLRAHAGGLAGLGGADHLRLCACAVPERRRARSRPASRSAFWSRRAGLPPAISAPTISTRRR